MEDGEEGGGGSSSTDVSLVGSSDAASYFSTRYAYRQIMGPNDTPGANQPLLNESASSIFDTFTTATWYTDSENDTVFVLGYKYKSMMVTALRFGQEMQLPVLLPYRRFRHDFAFASHNVLQAVYVPDNHVLVTCSIEVEGGPGHFNFFNFSNGAIIRRIPIDSPADILAYAPSMQLIYGFANEGGFVYSYDISTGNRMTNFSLGENIIQTVTPVPGNLSGCMFIGTNDGAISVWDLRAGKVVPGMRVLAHDFGVKSLVLSEQRGLLVSIGGPHPRRLQGLSPNVYAVLVWNVKQWVLDCREGDVYNRVTAKSSGKTYSHSHGTKQRRNSDTDDVKSFDSDDSAGEDEDPKDTNHFRPLVPGNKSMRPKVLVGHRYPITGVALQEETTNAPHIVSVDEGGQMKVWDLITGICLQTYSLFPPPILLSSNRGNPELGKAGLDGVHPEEDDTLIPKRKGLNKTQKQNLVNFITSTTTGMSAPLAAANSGLLPGYGRRNSSSVNNSGASSSDAKGSAYGNRQMSYGSASVMLYPEKGEGKAEMSVQALVNAGHLATDRGGQNTVVDGIIRTGNKYGVGMDKAPGPSGNSLFGPNASIADGDDAMVTSGNNSSVPNVGTNLASPPSLLSTALTLVGLPELIPTVSARRLRVIGDMKTNNPLPKRNAQNVIPQTSQSKQLAYSAASAVNTFRKEQQRAAEQALREAGISVASIPLSARKALLEPISLTGSSSTSAAMNDNASGSPPGRRKSLLGPDSNVLSSMLDLRLQGRRGSISDFAMMLQQEATRQDGTDGEERRKQLSEAAGGATVTANPDHVHDENRIPHRHIPGYPTFVLLMPKVVGGHEKRNLLVVGGERTGLTVGMAQTGGIASRHGMRVLTWMQDLPDREPLITSQFISPSLNFMTATAGAIVIWDALSGRPVRVYDNRICDGREIVSAILDKRQRKVIVGDVGGHQYVINLVSGSVMKQLDPRASKPRKAILAANEAKRKALIASMNFTMTNRSNPLLGAVDNESIDDTAVVSVWGAKKPSVGSTGDHAFSNEIDNKANSNLPIDTSTMANLDTKTPRGFSIGTSKSGRHFAINEQLTPEGLLMNYTAPLNILAFSPRLEIVSAAGDGSVWCCEERSDGWSYGTGFSTIVRVYSLPLEIYRTFPPLNPLGISVLDEPDPIIFCYQNKPGFSFTEGHQQKHHLITNDTTVTTTNGTTATTTTYLSLSPQPASSMPTLPSLEGGASILSGKGLMSPTVPDVTSPVPATVPSVPPINMANVSSSSSGSLPNTATTSPPPLLDGTIKVTQVAFSVRLNLLATCSRLLRDAPLTQVEGNHNSNSDEEVEHTPDPNAALDQMHGGGGDSNGTGGRSGLIDDDSYLLLLYDYEKTTLLGAFARAPEDRKTGLRHIVERYNAASSLGSLDASALHTPSFGVMESAVSNNGDNNSGSNLVRLDASSELLLPPATVLMFLDPLPALLSAHEDGGIRIWAVPPAAHSFSLRILFHIPTNPSLAVYSRTVKKVAQAKVKRHLTNTAKRIVQSIDGKTENDNGSMHQTSPILHKRNRRRSSVAGEDPEEIPSLLQRRYAVSITTRPAHLTPSMYLGSLFPLGHGAFMPETTPGQKSIQPYAPAPAPQLFLEAPKGSETPTGHVDPALFTTAILKNKDTATGLSAAAEGIILWCGDTDGEIHRFFITSSALAAAGLTPVGAVALDDTVLLERRLEDTSPHPSNISVGLSWSRSQSKAWNARQIQLAQASVGYVKAMADNHARQHAEEAASPVATATQEPGKEPVVPSPTHRRIPRAPPVHPALLSFYAQAGRHPFFPLVGETIPPTALAVADDGGIAGPKCVPFTKSVTAQGLTLAGPPGVIWENSWRAHQIGDVVSLQAIADSGFHGLLSAGLDGLARIWDTCGRLVGSLDPQPRFTAPMPEWERQDTLQELLDKTMAKRRQNSDRDDVFSLPTDASAPGSDSSPTHHNLHSPDHHGHDDDDRHHHHKDRYAEAAAIPVEYGPGNGSGYSFDRWSMTHVCTDRIYDGRLVYVPAATELQVSLTTNETADQYLPIPKPSSVLIAENSELANELPENFRPTALGMLGREPPLLMGPRIVVSRLASDRAIAIIQSVMLETSDVQKLRGGRRRSSVGMAATQQSISQISIHHTVPHLPVLSGTPLTKSVKPLVPTLPLEKVVAIANTTVAIVSEDTPAIKSITRNVGLYYSALAPPQRQVLWHITWDLVLRRASQLKLADQALSLVRFVKLRDSNGWGRRSSIVNNAARRLSQAMVNLEVNEALNGPDKSIKQPSFVRRFEDDGTPKSILRKSPDSDSSNKPSPETRGKKLAVVSSPLATAIATTAVAMAQKTLNIDTTTNNTTNEVKIDQPPPSSTPKVPVAKGTGTPRVTMVTTTPKVPTDTNGPSSTTTTTVAIPSTGKTVRISESMPEIVTASTVPVGGRRAGTTPVGVASPSSTIKSPRHHHANEETPFARIRREDPVAQTLHELFDEAKKEKESGYDLASSRPRNLPIKGAAFEQRMRHEVEKEAINRRRLAREKKEQSNNNNTSHSDGGSDPDNDNKKEEEEEDALASLVATVAANRTTTVVRYLR